MGAFKSCCNRFKAILLVTVCRCKASRKLLTIVFCLSNCTNIDTLFPLVAIVQGQRTSGASVSISLPEYHHGPRCHYMAHPTIAAPQFSLRHQNAVCLGYQQQARERIEYELASTLYRQHKCIQTLQTELKALN
jgi:hypothetical protein